MIHVVLVFMYSLGGLSKSTLPGAGNCYSESSNLVQILQEEHAAHELIGAAEEVLWPARRVAARVAILHHRSSNPWDPPGTAKWENQTEQTMEYQADQFGLYLAMQVHSGIAVDFVDEDALLDTILMEQYDVILVTQPNVPAAAIGALTNWAKAGNRLILSGGAAAYDEYNQSDATIATLTQSVTAAFPRVCLHEARQIPGPSPLPFGANGTLKLKSGGSEFDCITSLKSLTFSRCCIT
jgi:hypothetical protein